MGVTISTSTTSPGAPVTAPGTPGPARNQGGAAGRGTRGVFTANLVAQAGIVITGGLVRLTGSGLGCPTWPECVRGSLVPTSELGWHKYIEFGNRSLTFVLTALAVASLAAVLMWQRQVLDSGGTRRPTIIWLAAAPLIGTFAQALWGGVTVLTGLNPLTVAAHFLISAVIIGACVVLLKRSGEPADQPKQLVVARPVLYLVRALTAVALIVLAMGTMVTGSGPHSGDAAVDNRLPFDLRIVSWLHADFVLLFIGLAIGVLVAFLVTGASRPARFWASSVIAVSVAQGLVGYTQYFLGLPVVAVALHLLGAVLLWVCVVNVWLSTRTRGIVALT